MEPIAAPSHAAEGHDRPANNLALGAAEVKDLLMREAADPTPVRVLGQLAALRERLQAIVQTCDRRQERLVTEDAVSAYPNQVLGAADDLVRMSSEVRSLALEAFRPLPPVSDTPLPNPGADGRRHIPPSALSLSAGAISPDSLASDFSAHTPPSHLPPSDLSDTVLSEDSLSSSDRKASVQTSAGENDRVGTDTPISNKSPIEKDKHIQKDRTLSLQARISQHNSVHFADETGADSVECEDSVICTDSCVGKDSPILTDTPPPTSEDGRPPLNCARDTCTGNFSDSEAYRHKDKDPAGCLSELGPYPHQERWPDPSDSSRGGPSGDQTYLFQDTAYRGATPYLVGQPPFPPFTHAPVAPYPPAPYPLQGTAPAWLHNGYPSPWPGHHDPAAWSNPWGAPCPDQAYQYPQDGPEPRAAEERGPDPDLASLVGSLANMVVMGLGLFQAVTGDA